jgi:hypothetical protein
MGLFYLHQRRGASYIHDLEGAEFDTVEGARDEALVAVREMVSEMALTGIVDLTPSFEIVGEDGDSLLVPFSEAVTIRTDLTDPPPT